jgi:hypothetical protein
VVQSFAIKKMCQPRRTVINASRVAEGRKIKTAFSMSVHRVRSDPEIESIPPIRPAIIHRRKASQLA